MQPFRLLCLVVYVCAANAAVQNDAATDLAGFLPGIRYVYSYRSSAEVYHDVTLTATAQVSSRAQHAHTKGTTKSPVSLL